MNAWPLRARALAVALVLWDARGIRDSYEYELEESRGGSLDLDGPELLADGWQGGKTVTANITTTRKARERKHQGVARPPRRMQRSISDPERDAHQPAGGSGYLLTVPGSRQAEFGARVADTNHHLPLLRQHSAEGVLASSVSNRQAPVDRQATAESDDGALKIHAATFNAGNKDFKKDGDWQDLFLKMSQGSEDADIMLFGFQELNDPEYGFYEMARWKLWEKAPSKLTEELNNLRSQSILELDSIQDDIKNFVLRNPGAELPDASKGVVNTWATSAKKGLASAVKNHPSLEITREGLDRLKPYVEALNGDQVWQYMLELSRSGRWGEKYQIPEIELGAADIDMTRARQTYVSRFLCSLPLNPNPHYDTNLYVYVNPLSNWKIVLESFSGGKCKPVTSPDMGKGCNIDNNKGFECGKVVNVLRFRAEHLDGRTIRICAMNTHMSFARTAQDRNTYIVEAMDVAQSADCDTTVLVGDLNSRLHCFRNLEDDQAEVQPVFDEKGEFKDPGGSMLNVLLLFTQGGNMYDLTGRNRYADELTHMLAHDEVKCFEDDKQGGWKLTAFRSSMAKLNFLELLPPFNPTYKVASEAKAKKKCETEPKAYSVKAEGMNKAYLNPSGNPKHNPAWTDRVLVQQSPGASAKVLMYENRQISDTLESDHIPVVATVAIRAIRALPPALPLRVLPPPQHPPPVLHQSSPDH